MCQCRPVRIRLAAEAAQRVLCPATPPGELLSNIHGGLRTKWFQVSRVQQPVRYRGLQIKTAAVSGLLVEGWPLWAALSACAAGGQVHMAVVRAL